ncbi:hypothetical protein NDU88_003340 [Pleurodeles waltl]|uniref:DDE Tnp4 domain-containing protein n=1 Tax=Pleurodeles waltl TaxID=8319 RepID=A0AAV7TN87_PLEWA|nr:hypothetical protein NDU88_003340 [Pleurodeles waltl]
MWDAAPSCSGATAPPPDDANAHKNRETTKREEKTEERHVQCMQYRYRWWARQTEKPPALHHALGMVCLADQYISHVNAKFPGSVHDAYILRNSSISYVMGQLQRHRVWLLGDSGYPNLSWLLTPVRNPRTRAEERYNEAHGQTRRIIERTFGLLKARFRCLHLTGGFLFYSPKKVCQIIVACCMLHNLVLRRQVPFLQEDGPDGGVVTAVEPVDSEDEEAEEEDIDNRNKVILQYFQ